VHFWHVIPTAAGFARMIERAAASAGLEIKAHPHMLWHAPAMRSPTRTRYEGEPGLAGASIDHGLGRLHRAGAEPVQGLLAGLRLG
jgi:hypothetical protein